MMLYLIGKIVTTHGIKGEVKISSYSDFERYKKGNIIVVNNIEYKISSVRKQNDFHLIGFEGLNTLNDVMHLKGHEVFTSEEPKLMEDEFHLPKLIGLNVYDQNGLNIGIVDSLVEVPQGYLMRVKTSSKNVLIPFIKQFINEVNDDKIIVNVIEGLI